MSESAWQTSISPGGEHLVLYDGVFGLCNRLNNFVLARDTRAVFDFASLQSTVGRSTLARFGTKKLGDPWRWWRLFAVFPSALLDRAYDLTARYRYRLFGRYESCLMPSAEYKKRFIDPWSSPLKLSSSR